MTPTEFKISPDQTVRENLTNWIAALRSGQYKQGKYRLRIKRAKGDNFCCLGVACDLFDRSLWGEPTVSAITDRHSVTAYQFQQTAADLPPVIADTLGGIGTMGHSVTRIINQETGETNAGLKGHNLATANDQGSSFHAIANAIERAMKLVPDDLLDRQPTGHEFYDAIERMRDHI